MNEKEKQDESENRPAAAPIYVFAEVGSTNEVAKKEARDGAPHGTCWLADTQTAGRGRRHTDGDRREWFSPPGRNLYMSLLARPEVPDGELPPITLAIATALCSKLRTLTDIDIWLKWPNDLYVGPDKLAGILTEGVLREGHIEGVVFGLGLNVNIDPDAFPASMETPATSIKQETGERWDRFHLALEVKRAILDAVEQFDSAGLAPFFPDLSRYDRINGWTASFRRDGERLEGTARRIDPNGQLEVQTDRGNYRLSSGEVRLQPPSN